MYQRALIWFLLGAANFALVTAAAAQVAATQPAPPIAGQPARPAVIPLQRGQIIIQGGGRIIIQDGGLVILQGGGDQPDTPSKPIVFPIVNAGFASDEPLSGSLAPLIDALHAADYAKRELATQRLLRLPPNRLQDVSNALAAETDSEAIARLTQVAGHLYLKPRTPLKGKASVMGITLNLELVRIEPKDESPSMTVAIAALQPGFPAAQCLQVGDRIIALDGKRFPSDMVNDSFRARVNSLPPGAIADFQILRDGRLMNVDVQTAGVESPDTMSLRVWMDQRDQAEQEFLKSLKGASPAPAGQAVKNSPER